MTASASYRLRISSLLLAGTGLAIPAVLALAPSGTAAQRAAPPSVCPNPQPIPPGFDYPQSGATIEKWVDDRDEARARVHGWNLWAALNAVRGGKPVWQSWCTETQAFATQLFGGVDPHKRANPTKSMRNFKFDKGLKTGEDPINFPIQPNYPVPTSVAARYPQCVLPNGNLDNGPTLQSNGDVMVAGVIYNQPAYDWIRSSKIYLQSTLHGLQPAPGKTRQMKPMPVGSIALKPMMWPVRGTGFTALPVWDDKKSDGGAYAGFEIQKMWPRAVAVTAQPQSTIARTPVTFLHGVTMNGAALGPNTYSNVGVAPVQRFYNYRPNLAAMAPCDRAILDASAYYAYKRPFAQGDYLVLIAMHIMTKEQDAWTFQSVWWHDRPNVGPYAANRPEPPPGGGSEPWRHYLMTSTYGIPETKGGKSWPIAYNPYIELAANHPIRTNCMNCHHRAAWPGSADDYEAVGGPDALEIFSQDNRIFDGLIGVDSLWSISDRAKLPPSNPGAGGGGTPKR